MTRTVVFLGPSLQRAAAEKVLKADYRPPIQRGDLDALNPHEGDIIGIIDGRFLQDFAISPKEILRTLRRGTTVLGSSSMGALRAVELQRYGMIGVGKVFDWYRRGIIDADDEVGVVFAPDYDEKARSVPLVNIRYALASATQRGLIDASHERALVEAAERLYFPERTYFALAQLARELLPPARAESLREFLMTSPPDLKREDAVELLEGIAKMARACSALSPDNSRART